MIEAANGTFDALQNSSIVIDVSVFVCTVRVFNFKGIKFRGYSQSIRNLRVYIFEGLWKIL